MILINLLPHREAKRKKQQESFYANMAAAAIVGVLLAGLGWVGLEMMESGQNVRNQYLVAQNAIMQKKIEQITQLRAQIMALQARKTAVENLQADRNLPVRWMEELARLTPEGVYLTKVEQQGLSLSIRGVTLSSDRVSQFLANTSADNNAWITNSQWTGSIQATDISVIPNESPRRVYTFSLKFDLVRDKSEATDDEAIL